MCGRFRLAATGDTIAQQCALPEVPDSPPRLNIAPTQAVPVVRQHADGRALELLRWGLIPPWAKDERIGAKMINARAETVAEKPSFRGPFRRRRCLIIADGFYEWQAVPGQRSKQPHCFQLADGAPFAFAGLWEQRRAPDGASTLETCTIITTEANELLRPIHHRMPVLLPPDAYALWLDPDVHDPAALLPLLQPFPAVAMHGYPVSRDLSARIAC